MAITNDEFCLTVSKELTAAATAGDLVNVRQPIGLLEALNSAGNTANLDIQPDYSRGGKTNKVLVKYLQPDAEADATDENTSLCDETGVSTTYDWAEVEADQFAASQVKALTFTEMRALCETGNEFRVKLINNAINSVNRKINSQLITLFQAGAGGILNGSGALGTQYDLLWNDGVNPLTPNANGWLDMIQDLADVGMTGVPLMVGGGNFKRYVDLQGIACCNASGLDASQLNEVMPYYDNQIATTITGPSYTNTFFAFAPGAAAFVSRPQYVDQFRMVNDSFIFDTIVDPITGLEYDFELKFDECDKAYKWRLSLKHGLFQLPLDMFKPADARSEVNFNFSFRAQEGSPA